MSHQLVEHLNEVSTKTLTPIRAIMRRAGVPYANYFNWKNGSNARASAHDKIMEATRQLVEAAEDVDEREMEKIGFVNTSNKAPTGDHGRRPPSEEDLVIRRRAHERLAVFMGSHPGAGGTDIACAVGVVPSVVHVIKAGELRQYSTERAQWFMKRLAALPHDWVPRKRRRKKYKRTAKAAKVTRSPRRRSVQVSSARDSSVRSLARLIKTVYDTNNSAEGDEILSFLFRSYSG